MGFFSTTRSGKVDTLRHIQDFEVRAETAFHKGEYKRGLNLLFKAAELYTENDRPREASTCLQKSASHLDELKDVVKRFKYIAMIDEDKVKFLSKLESHNHFQDVRPTLADTYADLARGCIPVLVHKRVKSKEYGVNPLKYTIS